MANLMSGNVQELTEILVFLGILLDTFYGQHQFLRDNEQGRDFEIVRLVLEISLSNNTISLVPYFLHLHVQKTDIVEGAPCWQGLNWKIGTSHIMK